MISSYVLIIRNAASSWYRLSSCESRTFLVGGDRLLQLPGVVERVGVERRELVAALRVRVRRQELLVQLGAGRVQLLALLQLLRVLLVLQPLGLAGLRRGVDVGRRGQQRVLGQLARDRERFRVVLVVLVPVAALGVRAAQRLALLGGRDQVAVLLVGVDDAVLHARRVRVVRPLRQQRLVDGDRVLRTWSGRSRCRRGAGTPRARAVPSRGPCRTPSRAAGR